MFPHTRILNENKFKNIMKIVGHNKMSKYWFMENHFIPAIMSKTSKDLSSFMKNLENSFSRLVESSIPESGYGAKHKEELGGDAAEKEVIDAVKKYLTGTETFMSNVVMPDITIGKAALLRKLSKDVLDFVSNYKFTHPETKEKSFLNLPAEKEYVNKMLGKRMAMILGMPGNVYDDIAAPELDKKRMKLIYPKLLSIESGIFTAEQEAIINQFEFDKDKIKLLAKKIIDVIHKRKGEQEGKIKAEREYNPKKKIISPAEKQIDNSDDDSDDSDDDDGNQPPPPAASSSSVTMTPAMQQKLQNLGKLGVANDPGAVQDDDSTDDDQDEDDGLPTFPSRTISSNNPINPEIASRVLRQFGSGN